MPHTVVGGAPLPPGVSLASMAERKRPGGRSGSSGNSKSRAKSGNAKSGNAKSGSKPGKGKSERITGTAPSGADISKLEKMEASEEAKAAEPSTEDAMGQDKRRQVVGHSYGPSKKSQLFFFVAVAAVIVVVAGGYALAIAAFDQPQDEYPDKAPWSAANAEPKPTRSPAGPCGEPGNAYPPPSDSPCAQKETSTGEPAAPGAAQEGPETGPGGPTAGGPEAEAQEPPGN
jgi:hypothetical protein